MFAQKSINKFFRLSLCQNRIKAQASEKNFFNDEIVPRAGRWKTMLLCDAIIAFEYSFFQNIATLFIPELSSKCFKRIFIGEISFD